jgi:hypothetical protein
MGQFHKWSRLRACFGMRGGNSAFGHGENGEMCYEQGETFFEEQERQRAEKRLVSQLSRLGYHVELQPLAQAG